MWVDKEIYLTVPEQWKKYDDKYWVSDQGRVKRVYKNGTISYLTPISRKDKKKKCRSLRVKVGANYKTLNKLVWEVFKGPIPDGYTVVNKDGYATMNDLYNLKLISMKDVNTHSKRPTSKKIIDLETGWVYPSARDLGRRLKLSHTTIGNWCNCKTKKRPVRFEYYDPDKKYGKIIRFARSGH